MITIAQLNRLGLTPAKKDWGFQQDTLGDIDGCFRDAIPEVVEKLKLFFRRGKLTHSGNVFTISSSIGRVATIKPYKGFTLVEITSLKHATFKRAKALCNADGFNMSEPNEMPDMFTSKSQLPIKEAKWQNFVREMQERKWKFSNVMGQAILRRENVVMYYSPETESVTVISIK